MSGPIAKRGIHAIKAHMSALPAGFSGETIKLCSNESAFGPASAVIDVATRAVGQIHRYAEQGSAELQASIAATYNLDPRRIVCGPGSDELLARLCRAYLQPGDELIYSANGYAKFGNYALANDATPVKVPDNNFSVDVDAILAGITERTKVITIANPDNPTGTYVPGSEIQRLHQALPDTIVLVLDCAYAEYVDQPDYSIAAELVDASNNVVMTRTFSKIYGLAGLRLGWLYGPDKIIEVINKIGATFPISNIALECGIAAVRETEYTHSVFDRNKKLKTELYHNLSSLGINPIHSQTNFVMAEFTDQPKDNNKSAEAFHDAMWKQNIMLRRFPTPAFKNCIRISIGNENEMQLFNKLAANIMGD